MALDFPFPPSLNQTYQGYIFNGEAWVIRPDPAAPFVSKAGDTMGGALEVTFGSPPGDDDATPKKYVDDAIASGALYQGTWVAATNVPDLSGTSHLNGWAWVVITSDPHVNEATGFAIPGLPAGTMVGNGDRIVWNAGTSEFELIHSPGMTQTEADDRYLQLAGGTMNAVTGVAGGGTGITIANSSAAANAITLSNTAAGSALVVANSGTGRAMSVTGAGPGIYVNSNGTNVDILRQATAGIGLNINFATAGIAGTALAISNGVPTGAIGLSIGSSTEGNSAIQISRWTPDTSVRLVARHDGSLQTTVDTTSPNLPLDIRTTTANNPAVSRFSVSTAGVVTAQNGTNVAASSGGLVVGNLTTNATATVTFPLDGSNLVLPTNLVPTFYAIGSSPFTSLAAFIQDRNYSFRATLTGALAGTWPDIPMPADGGIVYLDVQKHNRTPTSHSRFVTYEMALRKFWNYMQAAGTWAGWQEIAILGQAQPQPWYFTRAGGFNWYAPITGYYNLIAAGPGGGGCNWVGSGGSAARYWCGGSGGVAGRRLLMQAGEILYISVPRGGYPAGGTGAQGAANFGPITEAGGNYQSAVINSPNYNSPGMPPGWTDRSLWIVAQFGLSGWNTTANAAYVEAGSGITAFAGNPPAAGGTTPGAPRGMSLGSGTRQITAQSGRGGSYMEAGGDGMVAISYDGPT